MPGLYNWATSSLYSVGSYAYNTTYNVTATVGSNLYYGAATVTDMLCPPAVSSWASDTFNQTWPGLMHIFDCVRVVPNVIHKKTRTVLGNSAYDNVIVQAGGVILSKVLLKQLVQAIPNPTVASVTDYSLDLAINAYFTSRVIPNAINNFIYASNANKAAYDENINDGNYKSDEAFSYPALQGMLASPIYQASKLIAVSAAFALADYKFGLSRYQIGLAGYQLHPGKWIDFSLKAFVYGQNLNEAKLTSKWISTEAVNKELSKNNWNSLAKGAVFLGSLDAMSWGISQTTGVNSWLIDSALFSFWYQYNTIASLLSKEPLPGKRDGIDIFYYNRYLTEKLIQDSFTWIGGLFQNPVECDLLLMPVLPVRDKIDFQKDFPGKSKTAYIIVGEQLYFLDRRQNYLVPIESVSKAKVKKLMHALKIPFIKSTDAPKCFIEDKLPPKEGTKSLSPQMMQFITILTGYSHPDAPQDLLGSLGSMVGHKVDCDLVFSGHTPVETELQSLPGSSKTAFVVLEDRFYFVDRAQKKVTRIENVGKEQIEKIKITLGVKLNDSFEKAECFGDEAISLEVLDLITLVTGCSHPDTLDWKKLSEEVNALKSVKLAKDMFLPKELKSFDAFMKSKPMSLYTSLQFASINNACEMLMRIRNEPLVDVALKMPDTVVNAEIKKYIRTLLAKWLDGILEEVSRYVYIKRANLGLDLLVHDVDSGKKHLQDILQKIDEAHLELNGGGVKINGKLYPASVAKIKELIEDVLGPNAEPLTKVIYDKTISVIRDELFGKSFATFGMFKIGARDEATAQLYRDILLMCIEMELPEEKLTVTLPQTVTPVQTVTLEPPTKKIEPQKVVEEKQPVVLPPPQPTLEEIRKANVLKAKQHLTDILEKVRARDYNLGHGGGESMPGETKKYPSTIIFIIEMLSGVLKPSAALFTVKTHNDVLQLIRKALQEKITDPGGVLGIGGSHKTTIKFYKEVLGMCETIPDEVKLNVVDVTTPLVVKKAEELTPQTPKVLPKSEEVTQSAVKVPVVIDTSSVGHMPKIVDEYDPLSGNLVTEKEAVPVKKAPSHLQKNSMFSGPLILPPTEQESKPATEKVLKH